MDNIFTYTRAEAIADGVQFECPLAKDAGFKFPVFITCGVNSLIEESLTYGLNDFNGVMWDILMVLFATIKANKTTGLKQLSFPVVINWDDKQTKTFTFISEVGALDFDKPEPAITIMLPDED